MDKKLLKQLRSIKKVKGQVNPDHLWVSKNRSELINKISSTVNNKEENKNIFKNAEQWFTLFMPNKAIAFARPVMTVVLAIVLTTGGWAISAKASGSLPGDTLYGVKIATEKVQKKMKTIVVEKEQEAEIHFKFAQRRLDEVKDVQINEKEASEEKVKKNVSKAIKLAKESVELAAESVEVTKEENKKENTEKIDTEKAVEVAKIVNKEAGEIAEKIKEIKETGVDVEDLDEIDETTQIVDDVSIDVIEKAIEVIEEADIAKGDDSLNNELIIDQEKLDIRELVAEEMEKVQNAIEDQQKDSSEENNLELNSDINIIDVEEFVSSSLKINLDDANQKVEEAKEVVENEEASLKEAVKKLKELKEEVSDIFPNIINSGVETEEENNIEE
jgi:hypothetical protein